MLALFLILLLVCPAVAQEQKLIVRVRNQVGFPITGLKAEDFVVTQDKAPRPVQQAHYVEDPLVDTVLLLETSEVGGQLRGAIQEVASAFVDRVSDKEQMAIVGYAMSADLVQDFTASKALLRRAIGSLKFGNPPALLDSIYAVMDGGFEHSAGRKVLVVIGSGADARDKVTRKDVLELARRNSVSIYAIVMGRDFDLDKLSEQTAGDYYRRKDLKQIHQVVENIAASFRGQYELVLSGAALDSGKLKVETPKGEKYRVSYRLPP